jgi:hypothetical protein
MLLAKIVPHVPKSASGVPQQNSVTTTGSLDEQTFSKCSPLLEDLRLKFKFRPTRVFIVDESGTSAVPSKLSQITGLKRKRRDESLVSAKGEELRSRLHAETLQGSILHLHAFLKERETESRPHERVSSLDGCRYTRILSQLTVIKRDWHKQTVLHTTRNR